MEVSSHWRVKQQRYALVGEECPHCAYKIFPPRDICPDCGEEAKKLYLPEDGFLLFPEEWPYSGSSRKIKEIGKELVITNYMPPGGARQCWAPPDKNALKRHPASLIQIDCSNDEYVEI